MPRYPANRQKRLSQIFIASRSETVNQMHSTWINHEQRFKKMCQNVCKIVAETGYHELHIYFIALLHLDHHRVENYDHIPTVTIKHLADPSPNHLSVANRDCLWLIPHVMPIISSSLLLPNHHVSHPQTDPLTKKTLPWALKHTSNRQYQPIGTNK